MENSIPAIPEKEVSNTFHDIVKMNFGISGRVFDRDKYFYSRVFGSVSDIDDELKKSIEKEHARIEYSSGFLANNGHLIFEGDIVEVGSTGSYHLVFAKNREGTAFIFDTPTERTDDPLEKINITLLDNSQEMAYQNLLPKIRCRRLKEVANDLRYVANVNFVLLSEGYEIAPGVDTDISLFELDKRLDKQLPIRWSEVLLYFHRKRKYMLGPNLL